ncbi:T9SS type A sorting domain-containing protein [Fulvivirga sedimenti]|uniref:T9SS type A sorting domain-containing protein n=1 Tax=Fulvivirga sedimenti TaxID=2879465 RepID=A0A9X1KWH8_9BACT|nr:T9SS type A sorting domain-containing protein [Fulvivirga sedimenti]MCA6074726.1 T9SS type A sorting domain-containing protein [Fulvivirga sedimenti]MCA6075903.1 T9SS type A sorting domain-containing protein [Fulvivirga sedimenti]MCA6077031.1 T9SS type A sorting domain-containing protein [Fulvivirga sedimenti]
MWRILNFLLLVSHSISAQTAWINEFHYDNAGIDAQEFIEVIAGDSIANLTLYLYNGVNGLPYDSALLDTLSWHPVSPGFKATVWFKPGIQNGPDGFALSTPSGVLDILSYEGDFTGLGGPAAGLIFEAVLVSETGTSPLSYSIQRTGPGSRGPHFTWKFQSNASPGTLNKDQWLTFAPTLVSFGSDTLFFGIVPFGTSSSVQSYDFTAVNISSDVSVYPPLGYEISLFPDFAESHTFLLPLILSATTDCLPYQRIYVRFKPPSPDGLSYDDFVVHETPGITSLQIAVRGTEGIPELPNMWINEFHYDNVSTDTLEFVEIVIQYPERYDLSKVRLSLYNGSSGLMYRSLDLNDAWAGEKDDPGFQLFVFPISGIQNGSPDGIALSFGEFTSEFISYEGAFTASEGPAAGINSSPLLPEESGETPPLSSIQRIGKGDHADSFEWILVPGNHTMGEVNLQQILPIHLLSYNLRRINDSSVEISWQTTTGPENFGFVLESSESGIIFDSLSFIPATSGGFYSQTISLASNLQYIRIRQLSFKGNYEILLTDRVPEITPGKNASLLIGKNRYILNYPGTEPGNVVIALLNSQAQHLRTLHDRIETNELNLTHWLAGLPAGMYLIRVRSDHATQTIRFIID